MRKDAVLTLTQIQRMLTRMQQTAFKHIVAKVKFDHNERFLILPKCFQLYSILIQRTTETNVGNV